MIAQEVGMPIELSTAIQAGLPTMTFTSMPDLVEDIVWQERDRQLARRAASRSASSVAITPWNYPLHQIAAKVAPALAAGCTVVAEAQRGRAAERVHPRRDHRRGGLARRRLQPRHRDGPVVGEAIASHPDVDMVSFTGSTRAGKRVSELAAQTVKRVALELGGKSPNVILDDADLETAVTDGVDEVLPELRARPAAR